MYISATSSRPNDIDKALRRPGRFDKEIELSVPDAGQRGAILRDIVLRYGIKISPGGGPSDEASVDRVLRKVADLSHGMVVSDLLAVVKEACFLAFDARTSPTLLSVPNSVDVDDVTRGLAVMSPFADTPQKDAESTSKTNTVSAVLCERDLLAATKRVSPSALKEIVLEVPSVRWEQVGGMDAVKDSLKEVVEWPLKYPELFRSLEVRPPRGVLLYGPPGCSKTLMAKCLATESSMNFLAGNIKYASYLKCILTDTLLCCSSGTGAIEQVAG